MFCAAVAVIELSISELTLPSSPAVVAVEVASLKARHYAVLTGDTTFLPYVVRGPAGSGFR